MPVKPFWAAFRALLESAGCNLRQDDASSVRQCSAWGITNARSIRNDLVFSKPMIVVRLGGALAHRVGVCIPPAFAAVESDDLFSANRAKNVARVSDTLKGREVGEWYCYAGALGAKVWAARDPHIAPDTIRIDIVVDGEIRRGVKPTNYAMGEFLRTVNHYVNGVSK